MDNELQPTRPAWRRLPVDYRGPGYEERGDAEENPQGQAQKAARPPLSYVTSVSNTSACF